uniref:Uncharacterized protein n=1 Tax=Glossina brevipalpis TaxID=37001 RepID=A0A1A9WEU4_9MUSC
MTAVRVNVFMWIFETDQGYLICYAIGCFGLHSMCIVVAAVSWLVDYYVMMMLLLLMLLLLMLLSLLLLLSCLVFRSFIRITNDYGIEMSCQPTNQPTNERTKQPTNHMYYDKIFKKNISNKHNIKFYQEITSFRTGSTKQEVLVDISLPFRILRMQHSLR